MDADPVVRPYAPGSQVEIDFHCKLPNEAARMSNPQGSTYLSSSYDYDDESESSSSGSSSSSEDSSSASGSSRSSSSSSSSTGGGGESSSSSSSAGTNSFKYTAPSNTTVSIRASDPKLRKKGGVSKRG